MFSVDTSRVCMQGPSYNIRGNRFFISMMWIGNKQQDQSPREEECYFYKDVIILAIIWCRAEADGPSQGDNGINQSYLIIWLVRRDRLKDDCDENIYSASIVIDLLVVIERSWVSTIGDSGLISDESVQYNTVVWKQNSNRAVPRIWFIAQK